MIALQLSMKELNEGVCSSVSFSKWTKSCADKIQCAYYNGNGNSNEFSELTIVSQNHRIDQ